MTTAIPSSVRKRSQMDVAQSQKLSEMEMQSVSYPWRVKTADRKEEDCLDCSPYRQSWPNRIITGTMKKKKDNKVIYSPFHIFKDSKPLIDYVLAHPSGTLNVMIEADRPVLVYFDIDRQGKQREFCSLQQLLSALEHVWYNFLAARYGAEFSVAKLKECEGARTVVSYHPPEKKKDSFHRHSTGLAAPSLADLNICMMAFKRYIEDQYKELKCAQQRRDVPLVWSTVESENVQRILALYNLVDGQKPVHVIDFCVYTNNRMFRLPFNCKPGGVPFLPMRTDPRTQQLITSADAFTSDDIAQWLCYALPHPESMQTPHSRTYVTLPEEEAAKASRQRSRAASTYVGKRMREIEPTALPTEKSEAVLGLLSDLIATLPKSNKISSLSLKGAVIGSLPKGSYIVKIDDSNQPCPHSGLKHPVDDYGKSSLFLQRLDPLQGNVHFRIETTCYRAKCQNTVKHSDQTKTDWSFSSGRLRVSTHNYPRRQTEIVANRAAIATVEAVCNHLFQSNAELNVPCLRQETLWKNIAETEEIQYVQYNERWCRAIQLDKKRTTQVIVSQCGTGKTVQMVSAVQRWLEAEDTRSEKGHDQGQKRVLSLTARQSLARSHYSAFCKNKLPVELYLECDRVKMQSCTNLIVTPDSCPAVFPSDSMWAPQLLILDEFRPFLKYIAQSSTLVGKRKQVLDTVMELIASAQHVIVLDADFSEDELELLSAVRGPATIAVHHNANKTNTKRYEFARCHEVGLGRLCEALREGKKVYVPCNTKKVAQGIAKMLKEKFPAKAVLQYDSESDSKTKATIGACNTEWLKYDAVITSPVIVYAVDMNVAHFHQVIGFCKGHSIDYESFFQMLERPRTLLDNTVTVCFENLIQPYAPVTREEIETSLWTGLEQWRNRIKMNSQPPEGKAKYNTTKVHHMKRGEQMAMLSVKWTNDPENPGRRIKSRDESCKKDPFEIMYRNTLHANAQSQANFLRLLAERICASGGSVRFLPLSEMVTTSKESYTKKVEEGGAEAEAKRAEQLIGAPLINEFKYSELKAKKDHDEKEKAQIDKFIFTQCYGYEPKNITDDRKLVLSRMKQMEKFRTFCQFARKEEEYIAGQKAQVATGQKLELESSRQADQFQAIESLLQLLGVKIGEDFTVNSKDELKADAVAKIKRLKLGVLFICGRNRAQQTASRFRHVALLGRLLDQTFPGPCWKQENGARKGKSGSGGQVYSYSWTWDANIEFLHSRLALARKRTQFTQRPAAAADGSDERVHQSLKPWAMPKRTST